MCKKKCCIILVILNFLFSNFAYSAIEPFCNKNLNQNEISSIYSSKPSKINIKISDYRLWSINNLQILSDTREYPSRDIISEKNKKRFKSKIEVVFPNNIKCKFNSIIRQSGDWKDHIYMSRGKILQSVDIKLIDGNINGITRFKLLIPKTRKNPEQELLFTKILTSLNFLAPRTFFVNVNLNNTNTRMLFQEKINKEMLEFNKRVEGPILEGDERYMWSYVKENNKYLNSSIKNQLARQTNSKWSMKSKNHLIIANEALTNLNIIYLNFINNIQNYTTKTINSAHYDLDNFLLGNKKKETFSNFESFDILMYSVGATHGLAPHNRKFYWNSIKNSFEPIYYDGDISIFGAGHYIHAHLGNHSHFSRKLNLSDIKIIKSKFMNLDKSLLFSELKKSGSELTNFEFKNLLKKIESNIEEIITLNRSSNSSTNKPTSNIFLNYVKNLSKTKTGYNSIKVVFKNKSYFLVCNLNQNLKFNLIEQCKNEKFENNEIRDLLEGRLVKNNDIFQYIGDKSILEEVINNKEITKKNYKEYNFIKIDNSKFFYNKGIRIDYSNEEKILNIYQEYPESRAYFLDGKIKDFKINFYGYERKLNEIDTLLSFPFDQNQLTGCLTFLNINLENVKMYAEGGNCEDTLNLIKSSGEINTIFIKEALQDGLDVDFSNLIINNILINDAGNDCADFSWGNYKIIKAKVEKCGDKGFSIGEKSEAYIKDLDVSKTSIGISSKDGSVTNLDNAMMKNTETCLEVKRKKQEFYGGTINIKEHNCEKKKIYTEKGSFINFKNVL
tara:strand:- start:3565 stop:5919 length:2355 start_codon:yes stop_codon:yes gene_type:complete